MHEIYIPLEILKILKLRARIITEQSAIIIAFSPILCEDIGNLIQNQVYINIMEDLQYRHFQLQKVHHKLFNKLKCIIHKKAKKICDILNHSSISHNIYNFSSTDFKSDSNINSIILRKIR